MEIIEKVLLNLWKADFNIELSEACREVSLSQYIKSSEELSSSFAGKSLFREEVDENDKSEKVRNTKQMFEFIEACRISAIIQKKRKAKYAALLREYVRTFFQEREWKEYDARIKNEELEQEITVHKDAIKDSLEECNVACAGLFIKTLKAYLLEKQKLENLFELEELER